MPQASFSGAQHYFNHLLFNPSGDRFMFFHLWVEPSGKRNIRMITCNRDGSGRYLLNGEGHISHYCWKSDTELLAYATHQDAGRHFYLYRDQTPERRIIGAGQLIQDGHPAFFPNGCERIAARTFSAAVGATNARSLPSFAT